MNSTKKTESGDGAQVPQSIDSPDVADIAYKDDGNLAKCTSAVATLT